MTEESSDRNACRGLIEEQLDEELRPQRLASFGDWLATRHLCSLAEQNLGLRLNSIALNAELSLLPGVRQGKHVSAHESCSKGFRWFQGGCMAFASPQLCMGRASKLVLGRAVVPAQQHQAWLLQASF